jgi:hypothetical protein
MGTKWIGTDGWVWVDRDGFDASNPEWVKPDPNAENKEAWASAPPPLPLPDAQRKIRLIESVEHRRNFLDSVKSRKPTITPVEVAHHSIIPGHLGLISMLTGRKIHWDVKAEKIVGDEEASKLLSRPYREGYKLA